MRTIKKTLLSLLVVLSFGVSSSFADGVEYRAYVVYGENLQAAMPQIVANLYNSNGEFISSSITDKHGIFSFKKLTAGETYTVHFSTELEPFGVDFADAFLLLKYLTKKAILSDFQLEAADVNGDYKVNHSDFGFIVSNWFVRKEKFPAGDWVFPVWTFTPKSFKATSPDGPITVVSRADISSELPPVIKEAQTVTNKVKEFVYKENQYEISLPISFVKSQKLYGLGLEMAFNTNDIEIIGINTKLDNVDFSIKNNTFKFSWMSENLKSISADQEFIKLNVRLKNNSDIESVLDNLTSAQFVGENGEILKNVQLNVPKLKKSEIQLEIGNPYPNPGDNEISIDLNQIYTQTLQVEIYNLAGQFVKRVSASPMNSKITISISDLPNGSYLCSINLDSERKVKLFNVQH
jgi:hypothetical protein